jgi:hypothetical protein
VDFLRQLESRRSQMIRKFELDLAAIDRLIALETGADSASLDVPTAVHLVRPQLATRRVVQRGVSPKSLAGQILAAVESSPDHDWTSASLWEELRHVSPIGGYQLSNDELKAKNGISATLGQLFRSGRIEQISPSNGAEPAIYRARKVVISQEPAEAGS